MKNKFLKSEVDAILTNEKILARLNQERNHLKRLIQENRLLEYRILAIDLEYCTKTGGDIHEATYSKGILTHQYLKGNVYSVSRLGHLNPVVAFQKYTWWTSPLGKLNQ